MVDGGGKGDRFKGRKLEILVNSIYPFVLTGQYCIKEP